MVEAWPLDALSIVPATAPALESIPESVYKRNGLWAQADDELALHSERDPSEYSCAAYEDYASVSDRLERLGF